MTPRTALSIAIAILGIWYVSNSAIVLIAMFTGPLAIFSTLIVGLLLLHIAKKVYRNTEQSTITRG